MTGGGSGGAGGAGGTGGMDTAGTADGHVTPGVDGGAGAAGTDAAVDVSHFDAGHTPPDTSGVDLGAGPGHVDGGHASDGGNNPPPGVGIHGPPGAACASDTPLSVPPLELAQIEYITPLGNLSPPGHTLPTTHSYLMTPTLQGQPGEGPFGDGRLPQKLTVRAPGNIRVVEISRGTVTRTKVGGGVESYVEDGLVANICESRYLIFGHITVTSAAINEAIAKLDASLDPVRRNCHSYSTGGDDYTACRYALEVDVAAGTVIGTTSGRAFGMDVGAYDKTKPTTRIGAGIRFFGEAGYTACAYDWFATDTRTALYAKLGDWSPTGFVARTGEPRCGTAHLDLPGTARGNWYLRAGPNDFDQEDLTLALASDVLDPSVPVFSIGNHTIPELPRGLYTFTPGTNGKPFAEVITGQTACYELRPHRNRGSNVTGKAILIALSKDATTQRDVLHIAGAPGTCAAPPAMPGNAVRFER